MSYNPDDDPFEKWLKFQWWIAIHVKYGFPPDFFDKLEEQFREMNNWANYQSMYPSINTKKTSSKKEDPQSTECICPCCKNKKDISYLNNFLDEQDDTLNEANQTSENTDSSIDIIEWDKKISITIELPMVSKEDINLDIKEDKVIIKTNAKENDYYKEILLSYRIKANSVKSTYKNGVLDIELEKKQ